MKIVGTVEHGSKMGRTLGFPTANVAVPSGCDAPDGVYAARVTLPDGRNFRAMANLGVKPTFSDGGAARVLEVHLFDFEGDLYGIELEVELQRFIRPEQKFADADALRVQIIEDKSIIEKICT
ncbi:MAG: riboflavin kinase [Alistipes sp.]|jgi:riboflavin kinase/FMN adenylyltransferase|nr:riboflavin kinase [Alistipes sp.]